jgi:DNA/RNA endonuclease YhcR with UshA esterase domain
MKSKGAPTFLDFGQPHPQQVLTAIIGGRWRSHFSYPPESLQGRAVCISGTITPYKGRAQIEVVRPTQIESAPQ